MNKNLQVPVWPFASFLTLEILSFTCSFVFLRCHTFYISLSFPATRCNSFTLVLPLLLLVVIRCILGTSVIVRYHLLSLVVPLVITRGTTHWHLMYPSKKYVCYISMMYHTSKKYVCYISMMYHTYIFW